jgi:hypothetical protein
VQLTCRPPLPPIARIIPLNLAIWNAVKGGSDTITKLLWMQKYAPPSKLPQASVMSRILLLSLACIHRLNQVATAKMDAKGKYKSLSHFRNAANQRMSFHKTIISTSKCSAFKLPTAGLNRSGTNHEATIVSPPLHECRLDDVTVARAPITTETPKRNVLKQYQRLDEKEKISVVHRLVLERQKKCTGQLIPDVRGTCVVCHTDCHDYCVLCHHHCHGNNTYPGAAEETFEMHIPHASGGAGQTFRVKNSCFWYLHKERFKEYCEHQQEKGEDDP